MRQAGTISNETDAQRFVDYLFTLGIAAKVDRDEIAWAVWVRDEEHVARAMSELADFEKNSSDPRFAAAHKEARARREALARREQEASRNLIDMRRRWDGRPTGPTPLTLGLIAVCILVAVLTGLGGQFGNRDDGPASGLIDKLLLAPNSARTEFVVRIRATDVDGIEDVQDEIEGRLRWGALESIRHGEVWRLITPIFLHFSPWHLLFNMSMLYSLGGLIESRRGSLRFGLLILLSAALSNFGQFYFPSLGNPAYAYAPFGGMSGVVYALFGYIWMKSRYEPTAELYVHPNTVVLMIGWMVVCMLGIIGNVANWAHGIGLAVGVMIGIAPYTWRQIKKRMVQNLAPRGGKE
jgi:GlpG protein